MSETHTFPDDSHVLSAGYDAGSSRLTIHFPGGSYEYAGVPVEVWDGLRGADSAGGYVHRVIKGRYKGTRT